MECSVCGHRNPPQAQFCANCGATLVTMVETALPATVPEVAAEYMGFWIRLAAAIIDLVIVAIIIAILAMPLISLGGVIGFFLLLLYFWLFTGLKGQTFGKMLVGIKVVDAQGNRPGLGIAALREIPGKIISFIVLFMVFTMNI